MRKPIIPVLGAIAATIAFAAPAVAAPATVGPLVLASGPSPFAGCTVGGPGTVYPNTEVEPFVSVNPTNPANLIAAFQQDRWSNGGARGLVTAASFDGGTTWTRTFPHFSTCAGGTAANGGNYERASDPWVSIGPDGRAYQVSLSFQADQSVTAILASTSTDGGLTWSEPATVQRDLLSTLVANDKESVTADPYRPGTAYVVWDRPRFPSDMASFGAGASSAFRGDPFFSMTTDGGLTWSTPRSLLGGNKNIFTIGNQITVLPDGSLVDVFFMSKGLSDPGSVQGLVRSTNGGATWSKPIVIAGNSVTPVVDPDTGFAQRTGSDIGGGLPDVAVDPRNGTLYVVFEDNRFSGGAHNDIALSKSTNGGLSWSTPIKANQSPAGVTAFTPVVDVLPDGTVGVTYYDWRNNTPDPSTLPTDHFIVHSHDGTATWDSEARITPTSFDDAFAPDARGRFLGDYEGLANDGAAFRPFFIQTNNDANNRTDAFATTATP
jgi:hypothetical protein